MNRAQADAALAKRLAARLGTTRRTTGAHVIPSTCDEPQGRVVRAGETDRGRPPSRDAGSQATGSD